MFGGARLAPGVLPPQEQSKKGGFLAGGEYLALRSELDRTTEKVIDYR
jgi:hypothetical protein